MSRSLNKHPHVGLPAPETRHRLGRGGPLKRRSRNNPPRGGITSRSVINCPNAMPNRLPENADASMTTTQCELSAYLGRGGLETRSRSHQRALRGMLTVRLWCAAASGTGGRPSAADMDAPSETCRRPDSTLCAPFMAFANCDDLGVLSAQRRGAHFRPSPTGNCSCIP